MRAVALDAARNPNFYNLHKRSREALTAIDRAARVIKTGQLPRYLKTITPRCRVAKQARTLKKKKK